MDYGLENYLDSLDDDSNTYGYPDDMWMAEACERPRKPRAMTAAATLPEWERVKQWRADVYYYGRNSAVFGENTVSFTDSDVKWTKLPDGEYMRQQGGKATFYAAKYALPTFEEAISSVRNHAGWNAPDEITESDREAWAWEHEEDAVRYKYMTQSDWDKRDLADMNIYLGVDVWEE